MHETERAKKYLKTVFYKKAPSFVPVGGPQWFFQDAAAIKKHIEKNALNYGTSALISFYYEQFEKVDIALFGESHSAPYGINLALLSVKYYNRYAAQRGKAKITDVFIEWAPDIQIVFDLTDKFVKQARTLEETESICNTLSEGLDPNYAIRFSYLCYLKATGVKIHLADLATEAKKNCPNGVCAAHKEAVVGTTLSPVENEALTLRNAAIFNKIKPVLTFSGKAVFLGGARHLKYGAVDNTLSLAEMIEGEFPLKNMQVFINAQYTDFNYPALVETCTECAKESAPLTYNFWLRLNNSFSRTNILVTPFVPAGSKDPAYKTRFGDYLIMFPRN